MKIFVVGKQAFDDLMRSKGITNGNVENNTKAFFISINDCFETGEVPFFSERRNVKVMFFDDAERDLNELDTPNKGQQVAKAFTALQAEELLMFIDSHKDKDICVVHCTAGISRSGAVGTFINEYIDGDRDAFEKRNPYLHPNNLVLRLLKEALAERNELES